MCVIRLTTLDGRNILSIRLSHPPHLRTAYRVWHSPKIACNRCIALLHRRRSVQRIWNLSDCRSLPIMLSAGERKRPAMYPASTYMCGISKMTTFWRKWLGNPPLPHPFQARGWMQNTIVLLLVLPFDTLGSPRRFRKMPEWTSLKGIVESRFDERFERELEACLSNHGSRTSLAGFCE